ncbi:MAG TPA: hypothetical protein VFN75_08810 [Pseudonocardiaceae bacterium]|nr:hypothetical protein [Pseudonocardiaceae bacterium]
MEATHHWVEQVRHRLTKEFFARTSVAEIATCIARACSDLDAPSPAALPELVERLARVRLSASLDSTGTVGR